VSDGVPDWVRYAVWWHLYPLGFVGAEREAVAGTGIAHRLDHLLGWLDYAVELGASGLLLGPVFASATHGYDTIDHFRIDPRLGDDEDFDRLMRAAHRRGLRVLLDGVFNHVGRDFAAFRQVLAAGKEAPEAAWFRLTWPQGGAPGAVPDYATFEGHRGLVALNHDEPAVAAHVARVMSHWLDRGADGWRLDAAYAVPPQFWAEILPRVRAAYPQAYICGEVIHGDYAAFVRDSGVDAVTQYELWKAIWSSLNDRNLFELAWAFDRHNRFRDAFAPLTFVGNHDVTRLASRLADPRHLAHALTILLTLPGTPSIYAGDEHGFRGVKEDRAGGDDAIRPAFPPSPADLAPEGWPLYRLHQLLIGLRRRHPWLHEARTDVLHLANEQIVYEARGGAARLVVALNLGDAAADLPAPDADRRAAGDAEMLRPGTAEARVRLPPHAWAILA
jgi:cyclomaltodextrinase / maltogenic alpha-amylase / neopullulanase